MSERLASNWSTDWAHPADEAELLELFTAAFGSNMHLGLWRWKYAGIDPIGVLVRRENRAVAFYGSIPRAISFCGTPSMAVQIGDVMVHPSERGVLTRSGPFFLAASFFWHNCLGTDRPYYAFAFGFPSERPYRVGERLGLYVKAGDISRVGWPALKAGPNPLLRVRPWDATMGAAVDQIWFDMLAAMSQHIVGVRDFAYFQHRYLEHPTVDYKIYLVSTRLVGKPFAIIVVRDDDDELELVDIVAPPARLEALVKIVRRLAFNLGKAKAYTWITSPHAALFAGETGVVSPTGIVIPAFNSTDPSDGTPPAEIDGRWWLMAGDMDFR